MTTEAPLDVPPPGAGLNTVTAAEPWVAMSPELISAVILVADKKLVCLADPFQFTTDEAMNPLPSTVRVKAGPPAVTFTGLTLDMDGTGLVGGE